MEVLYVLNHLCAEHDIKLFASLSEDLNGFVVELAFWPSFLSYFDRGRTHVYANTFASDSSSRIYHASYVAAYF